MILSPVSLLFLLSRLLLLTSKCRSVHSVLSSVWLVLRVARLDFLVHTEDPSPSSAAHQQA
jgi:hypothetical protein